MPKGYEGTRQVALQTVKRGLFEQAGYFVDPPKAERSVCQPAVTALDAMADLPRLDSHLTGTMRKGARRFVELQPYAVPVGEASSFAQQMRTWPGFENDEGVKDHVIRWQPRDFAIFSRMNPGDQYPQARMHAVALFEERLSAARAETGKKLGPNSKEFQDLWNSTVPPYDPTKFPNKWRKMEPDAPARTLMAHLGKDGYSHIHYDSRQARSISVREAARLMSFPDGFKLSGTMNPAFKQIGNAVPALLSKALAVQLHIQLVKTHAKKARAQKAETV